MIVLFVPPVAVEAADVGAAISRAVVRGRPARQAGARRHPRRDGSARRRCALPPTSPRFRIRRPLPTHSAARSSTGNGSAAPSARSHRSPTSIPTRQQRSSRPRSQTPTRRGSTRPRPGGCSPHTASRSSASAVATTPDEAVAAAEELGYPVRRQDRRGRGAQDGDRGRRTRPRRAGRGPRGGRAHRLPRDRAADDHASVSSSSPAWRRTRSSARSSPSALGVCSPSSSVTRTSG